MKPRLSQESAIITTRIPLNIAEPYSADGSQKLVFTLKMADLSDPLTPNTQWRVYFTGANGTGYFVDMNTNLLGGSVKTK